MSSTGCATSRDADGIGSRRPQAATIPQPRGRARGPATIYIPGGRYAGMADKPSSGEILGIPYNFERPSLGRLLSSYWQPGKGMLVEKPFGIGYTLNLANWRSWVVLAVAGGLYYQQSQSVGGGDAGEAEANADGDGPVEVIVEDD